MAQRVAVQRGGPNGLAPLCVKDKRKVQAAAAAAGAVTAACAAIAPGRSGANGEAGGCSCGRENGHKSGGEIDTCSCGGASGTAAPFSSPCRARPPLPVVIERSEIIRLASQYTPCAGCSAAVKGLLQRPIVELRLMNAVMKEAGEEGGGGKGGGGSRGRGRGGDGRHGCGGSTGGAGGHAGRGCGHGCNHGHLEPHAYSCGQASSVNAHGGLPRALCLREAYLTDRARLDQLLESFPLEGLMKKVQPKGVGLRCDIHRRNGGQSTADGWEWEDAWDRLPADMRLKVAAIDVDALEAAMHQATSTHRFCADCKHNVVTAFDILTCKCDPPDMDNEEEFLPDLFSPFADRIGPVPGDLTGQKALLSCPLEEVEELICWHEDFDSREYTRNSQRHAATLEHGQREIRSIVGSVLLAQLRTNYHNHLAQVQGEQYLFALVLHAIRTRVEGSGRGLRSARRGSGDAWTAGSGEGPSACPGCGGTADPGCPMCDGIGVSLSELGFVDDDDKKAKTKSKKKRERKARAKAAKKSQGGEEEAGGGGGGGRRGGRGGLGGQCNGHGASNGAGGAGEESERHQSRPNARTDGQRPNSRSGDFSFSDGRGSGLDVVAAGGGRSSGGNGAKAAQAVAAARQRAGSSGMESAGSLLSMLNDGDGCGEGGRRDDGDEGDEGIDEDLVREMERLRIEKAQTDVQRTRAALRSNLQKNFDQLLVSSTAREAGGKA